MEDVAKEGRSGSGALKSIICSYRIAPALPGIDMAIISSYGSMVHLVERRQVVMPIGALAIDYSRSSKQPVMHQIGWTCSREGMVKVNIDVSFVEDAKAGTIESGTHDEK